MFGLAKFFGYFLVRNVDTKPTKCSLSSDIPAVNTASSGSSPMVVIHTSNDEIFDPTDTILAKEVAGYQEGTDIESEDDLMFYVVSRDQNGVTVMAVNGPTINGQPNCIPEILAGTELIRMGRAASELDVQSPQFEALPKKSRNLCQIFKTNFQKSS